MTGSDHAAVGHRVEESLAPIPGGVKADGKPKTARAAQCKAKEKADERGSQQASPLLSAIPQVNQPETTRQNERRRPEADFARQSKLGVSAQEELFEEPHQQKHQGPEHREADEARSVEQHVTKRECMQAIEREHEQADYGNS